LLLFNKIRTFLEMNGTNTEQFYLTSYL